MSRYLYTVVVFTLIPSSFNLACAAGIDDTSSEKKLNVMASFYPMYDFATKFGGDKQLCRKARVTEMWLVLFWGK
ncbi:MAG: hypothetical protein EGQ94_07490 [Ruminococcus sp.]|nr:hypothetical protein [Ruminococcus sp.]